MPGVKAALPQDGSILASVFNSLPEQMSTFSPERMLFSNWKNSPPEADLQKLPTERRLCAACYFRTATRCPNCHIEYVFQTGQQKIVEVYEASSRTFRSVCYFPVYSGASAASPKVLMVAELIRDITDSRNMERELRLAKEAQEKNSAKNTAKTGSKPLSPGRRLLSASASAKEALEQMRARGVAINKENIASELQTLEEGFQAKVKLGLKAIGVDEKADFKVGLDESGKIIVNSEHADKDKIQKYFDDNPDLADLFKNIEALKNLKQVMVENASKANPIEIRKSIQMESIDALLSGFDGKGGNSSSLFSPLILSYGNNSLSSFKGLNLKV